MPGSIAPSVSLRMSSTSIQKEMILTKSVAAPLPPFPAILPTMVRDTFIEGSLVSSAASIASLVSISLTFVCYWETPQCGLCLARVGLPSGEEPPTYQLTLLQGSNAYQLTIQPQ